MTTVPKRVSAAVAWLPVSLEEAKNQVRVAERLKFHDQELTRLIALASDLTERQTDLVFAEGTFEWRLDRFPIGMCPIQMPRRNVNTVTKVEYIDGAGDQQTITDYLFSKERVYPLLSPPVSGNLVQEPWPTTNMQPDSVLIEYTAGYADRHSVPDYFKQQVLAIVDSLWHRRDEDNFSKMYESLSNRQVATYL